MNDYGGLLLVSSWASYVHLLVQVLMLVAVVRYRRVGSGTNLMLVGLAAMIVSSLFWPVMSLGLAAGLGGRRVDLLLVGNALLGTLAGFAFALGLCLLLRDVHRRLSLLPPAKDPIDELV